MSLFRWWIYLTKMYQKNWIVSCSVNLPWVLLRGAQKSRFPFLSSSSQRTTGFNANIFRNAPNSLLAGWPKYVPFQCCLCTDIRKCLKNSSFPKDKKKAASHNLNQSSQTLHRTSKHNHKFLKKNPGCFELWRLEFCKILH